MPKTDSAISDSQTPTKVPDNPEKTEPRSPEVQSTQNDLESSENAQTVAAPPKDSLLSAKSELSADVKTELPQKSEVNVFKLEDARTLDTATFDTTGLDSSTTFDSNMSVPNTTAKPFVLDTSEMSMEFKSAEEPKPKIPDPNSFGLGDSLFADAHNSTHDSNNGKKTSIAWIDDSFE